MKEKIEIPESGWGTAQNVWDETPSQGWVLSLWLCLNPLEAEGSRRR